MTSPGLALPGIPTGEFIKGITACVETGLAPFRLPILGAPMEQLMELVAASLARNGIECPPSGSVWRPVPAPVQAERSSAVAAQSQTARPVEPITLPEHNYRKSLQGDPAP